MVLALSGAVILLLYVLQMLRYGMALYRRKQADFPGVIHRYPDVTVLIPVRNEMKYLDLLVSDLENQDYPSEQLQVIFIDDHSTDGTGDFLRSKSRHSMIFDYLPADDSLFGKKLAIDSGCMVARGEYIIQTDADCRLPETFVSCHVAKILDSGASLVAGPVVEIPGRTIWGAIEALEHMSLTGVGMAGFLLGNPLLCSGASLSYSRKFYMDNRSALLDVPSPSGDDVFLLSLAKKKKADSAYLVSPQCIVSTVPAGNPGNFLGQRVRWASKARYYSDTSLIALSLLVWMTNLVITIFFVTGFFKCEYVLFFLGALLFKSLPDLFLLSQTARLLEKRSFLKWFPVAALFYYFYVTLAGLLAVTGRFGWKERNYRPQAEQNNN